MRIINAGYEFIDEPDNLKKIEKIARTCYKSENMIKEGSDVRLINDLILKGHFSILEHGNMIFKLNSWMYHLLLEDIETILRSEDAEQVKYITLTAMNNNRTRSYVFSGNIRALIETFIAIQNHTGRIYDNFLTLIGKELGSMKFMELFDADGDIEHVNNDVIPVKNILALSEEERMIHERFSVKFIIDRGISHELVRMRAASFAQESTRYCCYANDKFENEITVIKPCFFAENTENYEKWKSVMQYSEDMYLSLIESGAKAQEARDVLPTSLKTEIVVTANLNEWKHIFLLRACDSTGPAHPQIKEVMVPLCKEAKERWCFAFEDCYIKE